MKTNQLQKNKGGALIYLLIVIFVFSVIMMPIITLTVLKMKVLTTTLDSEKSLYIAEAGIEYYKSHPTNFPSSEPYTIDYTDMETQQVVGQFSLTVTPPTTGSKISTIQSIGWTNSNPSIKKTVTIKYGQPSLAQYSLLSNDTVWIGENETVNGQLMSNNGIRFDGSGNAPIKSAKTTYSCTTDQGCATPTTKNGIWGNATQSTKDFWQFPVPAVDFSGLTSNLTELKINAQNAGFYLASTTAKGYSLVFNNDGTFTVYKVTSLASGQNGWDVANVAQNAGTDYDERTLISTQNIPSNGIIFAESNVWVEGTIKGRAIVVSAVLPYSASKATSIYIPNNVLYSTKDGSDSLGLFAQKNIVVTYNAPMNLEINGAMIAQHGAAQFFYYPNNIKNSITIFGSIMTFGQWNWTWSDENGAITSGFRTTNQKYDNNLPVNPPPYFPSASSNYQQLNWSSK